MIFEIYPVELTLNKANTNNDHCPFIDLDIYCERTFIRGVPIFVIFVDDLIHEFKCPTK